MNLSELRQRLAQPRIRLIAGRLMRRVPLESAPSLMSLGSDQFAYEQGELWITIGGGEEQRGGKTVKHAGGTPVKIDKEGTIHAGPPALKGKKIDDLSKEPKKRNASSASPRKTEPEPPLAKAESRPNNPPVKESVHAEPEPTQPHATAAPSKSGELDGTRAAGNGDDGRGAELGGADGGGDRRPASSRPPEERIVTARPHLTKPADPNLVSESLRQHLAPHQVQGAAKAISAIDQHGGFLLADGTGAGKTRTQLAVAKTYADRGKKVLIVTKSEVIKPDWKSGQITGSFKNDAETMGIPISLSKGEQPLAPGQIAVTTYNRLNDAKKLVDGSTVLILDESHSLKNNTSARAKHGYDASKAAYGVMYATATPADKPMHVAHLFRARVFGDRKWDETYRELGMERKEIRTPHGTISKWDYSRSVKPAERYRRMAGLFDRLTEDGLMLKRELSFDGLTINSQHVDLPPECHEAMDRIEEAITESSNANEGLTAALVRMQQRRQQEPYKIPAVVDRVKKELADGRHVIVFASRVNKSEVSVGDDDEKEVVAESEGTAKLLKEALEKDGIGGVLELHGGVTPAKRIKAMEDFQAGKGKVIIATIEAGGTGINLDDTAGDKPRSMIVMTAPFSAVENVQALGRAWRLKTKSDPRFYYLFGDTDVDHWNAQLMQRKMKTLGAAVAGESKKMGLAPQEDLGGVEEAEMGGEPYKWRPLIGGSGGNAHGESISTRTVNTSYGTRHVHSFVPDAAAEKLLNSPDKPRWLTANDYRGRHEVTVWGDTPQQVRERVEQLRSGALTAPKPAPTQPPKTETPDVAQTESVPSIPSRKVRTSRGERHVTSFRPNEAFWKLWKSSGRPSYLSVTKGPSGSWEGSVWGESPEDVSRNAADLKRRGVHVEHYEADEQFAADSDEQGVWRQIGAVDGEDGERHGGTPVLMNPASGKILIGPAKLAGKKVGLLSRPQRDRDRAKQASSEEPDEQVKADLDRIHAQAVAAVRARHAGQQTKMTLSQLQSKLRGDAHFVAIEDESFANGAENDRR